MSSQNWMQSAVIYQVFCGRWELGSQAPFFDQFGAIPWKRIAEMGFNTVYLLGIWDYRGPVTVMEEEGRDLTNVDDRTPSMMSISNHRAIDPSLGHQANFLKLVDYLHQIGLRVIVDFVPNHTSLAHPWVKHNPDFYHWHEGALVTEFSGDVAKLNYANKELRNKMLETLKHIASWKVDGVRVDMAHLVPLDFWDSSISNIKETHPEFGFLAECYPHSIFDYSNVNNLLEAGFDAVYDSGLYKNIFDVVVNLKPPTQITDHLNAVPRIINGTTVHYWGNHDDPPLGNRNSEETPQLAGIYTQMLEALIVLVLFVTPGGNVVFNGSLLGRSTRLAHHWKEMLALSENELFADLPERITNIMKLFRTYQHITIGRRPDELYVEHELVRAAYNVPEANRQLILYMNFARTSRTIESSPSDDHGLLHDYPRPSQLPSGEAEIYFV